MIASAAEQEDVDVIQTFDSLRRAQYDLSDLMKLLRAKGMQDVTVLVGGIIPEVDIPALQEDGIAGIFLPEHFYAGDCGVCAGARSRAHLGKVFTSDCVPWHGCYDV